MNIPSKSSERKKQLSDSQKKSRNRKKQLGLRQVSVYLSNSDFDKLTLIKKMKAKTNAEIFSEHLNNIYSRYGYARFVGVPIFLLSVLSKINNIEGGGDTIDKSFIGETLAAAINQYEDSDLSQYMKTYSLESFGHSSFIDVEFDFMGRTEVILNSEVEKYGVKQETYISYIIIKYYHDLLLVKYLSYWKRTVVNNLIQHEVLQWKTTSIIDTFLCENRGNDNCRTSIAEDVSVLKSQLEHEIRKLEIPPKINVNGVKELFFDILSYMNKKENGAIIYDEERLLGQYNSSTFFINHLTEYHLTSEPDEDDQLEFDF